MTRGRFGNYNQVSNVDTTFCDFKEQRNERMEPKHVPFVIERARAEDGAALLQYLKIIGGETNNLSFGPEGVPLSVEAEEAVKTGRLGDRMAVELMIMRKY